MTQQWSFRPDVQIAEHQSLSITALKEITLTVKDNSYACHISRDLDQSVLESSYPSLSICFIHDYTFSIL